MHPNHLHPSHLHPNHLHPILAILALVIGLFASTVLSAPAAEAQSSEPERVIDTFAIDHHGNGSQLIVRGVELHDNHTLVTFELRNGRDFAVNINAATRDTRLEDQDGNVYRLLSNYSRRIDPGRGLTFSLGFQALPDDAESITVFFRDRDDLEDTPDEGFPGYLIADIDLTDDTDEPSLPEDFEVDVTIVHPNESVFTVEEIAFENDLMRIDFTAFNPSSRQVTFSSGRHVSFLEDDLGNRYFIKLGDGEFFLRADRNGGRLSGSVAFIGRIHPDATSVRFVLNDDESTSSATTSTPKFEFGPWDLETGEPVDARSSTLAPLQVDDRQNHPNSSSVEIVGFEFTAEGVVVEFRADNPRNASIFLRGCCDAMYLLDDQGNRYENVANPENRTLRIESRRSVEGTLFFAGQVADDATTIELFINDRDDDRDRSERATFPEFAFGPYELERIEIDESDPEVDLDDIEGLVEALGGDLSGDLSGDLGDDPITLVLPTADLFDEEGRIDSDAPALDQVAAVLTGLDADEVLIEVHSDSSGAARFNELVTQDKAEAVAGELVDRGIDGDRLEAVGAGEDDPVETNRTDAGRAANNRIEITIEMTVEN